MSGRLSNIHSAISSFSESFATSSSYAANDHQGLKLNYWQQSCQLMLSDTKKVRLPKNSAISFERAQRHDGPPLSGLAEPITTVSFGGAQYKSGHWIAGGRTGRDRHKADDFEVEGCSNNLRHLGTAFLTSIAPRAGCAGPGQTVPRRRPDRSLANAAVKKAVTWRPTIQASTR